MGHLTFLEQFKSDGSTSVGPLPEELPGYSDGFAAGIAAAAEQSHHLNQAMVDKFTELRFGYAEAHQELLGALNPFIGSICNQILPDILDDLTRSKLIETLLFAAQSDISAPLTITTHPSNSKILDGLIVDWQHLNLKLSADPTLGKSEIFVSAESAETQLDVDTMVAELRAALSNISENERI